MRDGAVVRTSFPSNTLLPHFLSNNNNNNTSLEVSVTSHPACLIINPPPGDGGTVQRRCSNRITGGREQRSFVVNRLFLNAKRPKLIDSQPSGDSWMSPSSLLLWMSERKKTFTVTLSSLHTNTFIPDQEPANLHIVTKHYWSLILSQCSSLNEISFANQVAVRCEKCGGTLDHTGKQLMRQWQLMLVLYITPSCTVHKATYTHKCTTVTLNLFI